jgi:hypothetical protein
MRGFVGMSAGRSVDSGKLLDGTKLKGYDISIPRLSQTDLSTGRGYKIWERLFSPYFLIVLIK